MIAVDWHHPQWLAIAVLIVSLSCLDAFMTLMLVEHGAREANPLMAPLVAGSALKFALVKIALDHDVQLRIVEAVLAVNDNRKRAMARKVSNAVGGSLRGKTVAVLGLTFKPDTDDMREAPSIPLVTGLLDMGAKVRAHDPVGMEAARRELPDIEYCDDPYLCARGADAMVVVTEWAQYRALDLERLKSELAHPVVVDLRNVYRPEDMAAHGFIYESVGRPAEQA